MKAEVKLICSRCGKEFAMSKGVETQEEKESWGKWVKDTYKNPYCPECMIAKAVQQDVTKGVIGGSSVAIRRLMGEKKR